MPKSGATATSVRARALAWGKPRGARAADLSAAAAEQNGGPQDDTAGRPAAFATRHPPAPPLPPPRSALPHLPLLLVARPGATIRCLLTVALSPVQEIVRGRLSEITRDRVRDQHALPHPHHTAYAPSRSQVQPPLSRSRGETRPLQPQFPPKLRPLREGARISRAHPWTPSDFRQV